MKAATLYPAAAVLAFVLLSTSACSLFEEESPSGFKDGGAAYFQMDIGEGSVLPESKMVCRGYRGDHEVPFSTNWYAERIWEDSSFPDQPRRARIVDNNMSVARFRLCPPLRDLDSGWSVGEKLNSGNSSVDLTAAKPGRWVRGGRAEPPGFVVSCLDMEDDGGKLHVYVTGHEVQAGRVGTEAWSFRGSEQFDTTWSVDSSNAFLTEPEAGRLLDSIENTDTYAEFSTTTPGGGSQVSRIDLSGWGQIGTQLLNECDGWASG